MPIRIIEAFEPLSDVSWSSSDECLLVDSDASRMLTREMRRYCRGELTGRSFLIAGHRGSGKTTMVANAFLKVWRDSQRNRTKLRPLLVMLHGPSVLPNEPGPAPDAVVPAPDGEAETDADSGVGAADSPAIEEALSAATEVALAQATGGDGAAQGVAAKAAATKTGAAAKPKAKPAKPVVLEESRRESDAQIALKRITLYLHRAVAREFAARFWQHVRARVDDDDVAALSPNDLALLELAAQFEAELYESPTSARLRQFWARSGALTKGILAPPPNDTIPFGQGSQGMRELIALAGLFDAYRRIAGKYEQSEKLTDDAKRALEATLGGGATGKELVAPIAALLTGGLVGTGLVTANQGGPTAVMAGIIAALGASLVFKASSTRSRSQSATREYKFVVDTTESTLDRVLPILIERLLRAGLAPIFVVDELDKVHDLARRMDGIVHYLKKIVAESAFFCFLTDRAYFEEISRSGTSRAYPVDYSYFSHQLFVVFREQDLHDYLAKLLEPPAERSPRDAPASGTAASGPEYAKALTEEKAAGEDRADVPVLRYVLLHRSRMHALDLRRRIAGLRSAEGTVALPPGEVRSTMAYRLDTMVQVGIEIVLGSKDLSARLDREPEFRRVAYDAMYYLSRAWVERPADQVDVGPSGAAAFRAYLERRTGLEGPANASDGPLVTPNDSAFLFGAVRELAVMLSDGSAYRARLRAWTHDRGVAGLPPVEQPVIDALPLPAEATHPGLSMLRSVPDHEARFVWRYDASGRELHFFTPGGATKHALERAAPDTWMVDAAFIEAFSAALAELTR